MEISKDHHYKILKAVESQKVLVLKTRTFDLGVQEYLENFLSDFLEVAGLENFKDQLLFCLKELGVNAKKANTKRLFFQEEGLELKNEKDYVRGMSRFKARTLGDQKHYLELLRKSNFWVKFEFQIHQNNCTLAVKNNSELLEWERRIILDKLAKAQLYGSLEDAFVEVLDETEGAGLGLVVMMLMLKNLGFRGDFFSLYTLDKTTVARIILPMKFQVHELQSFGSR